MAEEFGFYDPVLLPDGTYDREYNAKSFSVPFNALINTGVMKGEMNELAVTSDGLGMITKIDTGIAFINGRYYKNTSFKTHQHDTESLGVSRIDRIVIRMNEETNYRSTLSYVKKGVPSANPVPPALTQTENIYEISLAQVKVVGGQTFIAADAITDERGKDIIGPWAGSNILPSFDDNALAEHIKNTGIHVTAGEKAEIAKVQNKANIIAKNGESFDPNTTLEQFFITNHPSLGGGWWYVENKWYSGRDVGNPQMQVAYSYIGNVGDMKIRHKYNGVWSPWSPSFQSVSSGKQAIANATTDMGVQTAPDAEFATMAANIRKIATGKKFATGITYVANQTGLTQSGLQFTPSIVILRKQTAPAPWVDYMVYASIQGYSAINGAVGVNESSQQVPFAANATMHNGSFNVPNFSILPYTGNVAWIAFE